MQLVIRILLASLLFFSMQVFAEGQIIRHPPKTLPDLPLYDLNDKEFFLESLEGNVVLLHFWASWCTQCSVEMQKLNRLQKLVRKDPIIVVPVSENFKTVEQMKAFYKDNHLRYLLSFFDKGQRFYQSLDINHLPTTFILNGHMEHVATVRGSFDWADPDNIKHIKEFILNKEVHNPDYVELFNKQDNLKKDPVPEPEKPKIEKKEIPQNAMTDVALPDLDKVSRTDTNINVTNAH